MLPWLQLFLAVLGVSISTFRTVIAATIRNNPTLGGISGSTNVQTSQGISSNSTAVGFTPWPSTPFGYILSVDPLAAMTYVQVYIKADRPFVRTQDVVAFVQNFQKELEEHYSGTDILPRKVGVRVPDPQSSRNWHIFFESRLFSKPMLTGGIAFSVLKVIEEDLKAHGLSSFNVWISEKIFERGYASLSLRFEKLGAVQEPGCSGNGSFYTCSADDNTDAPLQVT